MPTRSWPAGDVVDEVVRPCGTGVFEMLLKNVQFASVRTVECPPDCRLADRYTIAARRFDGGDRRGLLGQIAFERAGHDDGEVGLQQEVVDGRG